MKRIAICLSGETRAFDLTKRLNSTLVETEEYTIDFFIATWDSNYTSEYLYYPNLKGCEILKEEEWEEHTNIRYKSNNFKYSFLLKKCNLLKQKYELDNNFVYDCVVISRIDVIFRQLLTGIDQFLEEQEQYDFDGLVVKANDEASYCDKNTSVLDDNFCITNSLTSDLYTNIHFLYYGKSTNKLSHSLEINAYILRRFNIIHTNAGATVNIVRPSNVHLWIEVLVRNNALDYNMRNDCETGFQNARVEVYNVRLQVQFRGSIIIDIRNKDYVFDKLGYLSLLEQFISNLALKSEYSKVILLGNKGAKDKIEKLNLRLENYKVVENKTIKEVLALVDSNNILLTSPNSFISFDHNFFYEKCTSNDLVYLRDKTSRIPYNYLFVIKGSVINKLLDLNFDSLEDIDLKALSKEVESVARYNLHNTTDIDKVKNIYQSLI
jgi:hypothetical protein